jgi:hypothetical protein
VLQGYARPGARNIKIVNNGMKDIKGLGVALKSGKAGYEISGPADTLGVSQSAIVTVQPYSGFEAGNYDDVLEITAYGNVKQSIPLKFTVDSYGMSVGSDAIGFGKFYYGYAQPAPRSVMVTNTGTRAITGFGAVVEGSDAYSVGGLGDGTLDPGERVAVTVTPRAGLGVDGYAGTLRITGREVAEKAVALNFEVIDAPDVPGRDAVYVSSLSITGAPAGGTYLYRLSGANSLKLGVAVGPSDATNRDVEWKSGNASVAGVDGSGRVSFTGVEGSVVITAAARDGSGRSSSVVIKVAKNVTKIRTPLRTVYIKRGKSFTIPAVAYDYGREVKASLSWKSSRPGLVKVTQKGRIKAAKRVRGKRSAIVTIATKNGEKLKVRVVVVRNAVKLGRVSVKCKGTGKAAAPKVSKRGALITLKKGKSYILKIKLKRSAATGVRVTFKSSKPGVLKVDKAGKLTALKKGKARITVKAGNLKYAKTIKVA